MSRILKSNELNEGVLPGEFTFVPLSHNFDRVKKQGEAVKFIPTSFDPPSEEYVSFVPMSILDEAVTEPEPVEEPEAVEEEYEEPEETLPPTPPPPLPPSVTMTEEEFESMLAESYQSGLNDGKSLTERGLLNVFNSLRTATENINLLREKVLRESEDTMLKLVMMIARRIILREAKMDATILENIIKAALADITEKDEIVIHLHPDDYSMVTSRSDFFPAELMTERMRLKPDPTVNQGSCKVSTEIGIIDADFDSQLDEIYRHLLEARNLSKAEIIL